MPTTDVAIKNAIRAVTNADKPLKLFDGGGLFLLLTPAGGRYWRLKYRMAGKEKLLALGVYPVAGLAAARKKRDAAREQVEAATGLSRSSIYARIQGKTFPPPPTRPPLRRLARRRYRSLPVKPG